jgi:hypothetical protein
MGGLTAIWPPIGLSETKAALDWPMPASSPLRPIIKHRLVGSVDQGEGAHQSTRALLRFSRKFRTAAAELVGEDGAQNRGSPKSEGAATNAGHGSLGIATSDNN